MVELSAAGLSDVGQRENNEDAFLIDEALGLYVVADGMGGHAGGEVASATAVAAVRQAIAQWHSDGRPEATMPSVVSNAIQAACAAVHDAAARGEGKPGMGTTMTLLLVEGGEAVMGHVGDSRLLLVRDGRVDQISTDHTLPAELYREGILTQAQVRTHPHASVLTRCLGTQASVAVETLRLELRAGDVWILSSDGLDDATDDRNALLSTVDAHAALPTLAAHLVAQSKDAGATDNITAVVVRVDGDTDGLAKATTDLLRAVPLLATLSSADLHRVVAAMTAKTFAADAVVAERGAQFSELLVVVSGCLRWEVTPGHYGELRSGAGIGGTTLVRARKSPGRLTATEATQALSLSAGAFSRLVTGRPHLGVRLLRALAEELSDWIDPDSDRGIARPPHGLLIEF